jgi:ATP-dependent DNA helicase RecG
VSRLESLKGVGPKLKEKLNRNQIYDCFDLIFRYPNRYEIYKLTTLKDAIDGQRVTLEGIVSSAPVVHYIKKNLNRLSFTVLIDDRLFKVSIFNRDYLKNIIKLSEKIVLTGTMNRKNRTFTATTLKLEKNFNQEIEPVYNISGISDKQMGNLIWQAIDEYSYLITDDVPNDLLQKYKLIDIQTLLRYAHRPQTLKQLHQVDRRIKYEELLKFQMQMQYVRLKKRSKKNTQKMYDKERLKIFINRLPYELTNDQKKAVNEIVRDLKSPYVMNRLLQGDVGSGKTVVAAISIYSVLLSGFQVTLMAPTEILASQHYKTFKMFFNETGFEVLLLTGKLGSKERKETLEKISKMKSVLVIGTHALFSEDVKYNNLGYVITDEQHRFGVEQRRKLRQKGFSPDVLYMSATPIPRTLAISLFGDMDITTIKEKPKKRLPVETKLFSVKEIDMVYMLMEEELRKNHQIFVVTPLILENTDNNRANAQNVYSELHKRFDHFEVGLLHSKIPQENKEIIMEKFEQGIIDILVSTTVVEVGVDIPNSTMMIIFDSDRFGLSQLHQLRGRVGRGSYQSYCLLLHSGDKEVIDRLSIMEKTDDGFRLSEADLKQRGAGDFFGIRQSGYMKFERADIVRDINVLEVARQDALEILTNKENYYKEMYKPLFRHLKETLKRLNLD